MLIKRKKLIFQLVSIGLMVFIILAPIIILPVVFKLRLPGGLSANEGNFLMLWHIDTIEAGASSQSAFLERRALEFEKANKGSFIVVKRLSYEQAVLQLENGYLPDMVSFSMGVGELLEPYLKKYTGSVYSTPVLSAAGEHEGVQKAVPWCMGGYVLIAKNGVIADGESPLDKAFSSGSDTKNKERYSLTYGGEFNVSLLGLLNADKTLRTGNNKNPMHEMSLVQTQYEAYEEFVSKTKSNILLGSQRDFVRVQNRVNNGGMQECTYEFLHGFSDLVTYFGITATESEKYRCAVKFIEYSTSDYSQGLLPDTGMFSINGKKYHTEPLYREYEAAVLNVEKTVNVFTSKSRIIELKNICVNLVRGQEDFLRQLRAYLR